MIYIFYPEFRFGCIGCFKRDLSKTKLLDESVDILNKITDFAIAYLKIWIYVKDEEQAAV